MTKQTNNKPQSLDDYFARAKETKTGMSAKQVSDLIGAAPAAKLSWLAYMKPLASKINSILIISALAVISYFAVDVGEAEKEQAKKDQSVEALRQESMLKHDLQQSLESNTVKKESKDLSEDLRSEVKILAKNTVNTSNTKQTSYAESKVQTDNLKAESLLIAPSSTVIVQNDFTFNHKVEYVPFIMERSTESEELEVEEEAQTFETLVGNNSKNMYYFQVDTKFTKTSLARTIFVGGKVAWMPSHNMSFGLAGYGMTKKPVVTMMDDESKMVDGHLYLGYGGFFMEYYFFPKEVFHGYIGGFFGLGGVHAAPVVGNLPQNQNNNNSIFWVVEPNVGLELNITSYLKVGVDISYRYSEISGKDKLYAQSSDLTNFKFSGMSTGIYFKLGLY